MDRGAATDPALAARAQERGALYVDQKAKLERPSGSAELDWVRRTAKESRRETITYPDGRRAELVEYKFDGYPKPNFLRRWSDSRAAYALLKMEDEWQGIREVARREKVAGKGEVLEYWRTEIRLLDDAAPGLDRGAEVDPALAGRARELAAAGANARLGAGEVDQKGEMGLGLFDAADQPGFRLDEEGPERTSAEMLADIEADEAMVETLRGCL